ncbi:uncharacterized protein LDX57_006265 [Aspergillus melleus]|uniref:uncharacterized protein n=1 Tax=Aspergillus melleus TaxID=138277 RepID=UPI001E8DE5D1|nr:uncharacterized protein LDX57_006265 [Aspergillus melleus]KAH8428569.1 hypothetical protein LDX57_006265 [Aspergillus melleus]
MSSVGRPSSATSFRSTVSEDERQDPDTAVKMSREMARKRPTLNNDTTPIAAASGSQIDDNLNKGKAPFRPVFSHKEANERDPFGATRLLFSTGQSSATISAPPPPPSAQDFELLKMRIQVLKAETKTYEALLKSAESEAKLHGTRAERYKKIVQHLNNQNVALQKEMKHFQTSTRPEPGPGRFDETLSANIDIDEPVENVENVRIHTYTRAERQGTADTVWTTAETANWHPRDEKPREPLGPGNVDNYHTWRFAMDQKLRTDYPLYPDEVSKIAYAQRQMTGTLFTTMNSYATCNPGMTYDEFMKELENYLGIHLLEDDARRKLVHIKQDRKESVTDYYQHLIPLWTRAGTANVDRVLKLRHTVLPHISTQLDTQRFSSVMELLDAVRQVECNCKEMDFHFPCGPRSQNTAAAPASTAPRRTAVTTSSETTAPARPNTTTAPSSRGCRFTPSSTKSAE